MNSIATAIPSGDWTRRHDVNLPRIGYGPFHIFEAAPWLFLATVLRIIGFGKPVFTLICLPLAMVCIIFAFLLATRRTIEFTGGKTGLEKLDFSEQVKFAKTVLKWWFGIMLGLTLLFVAVFQYKLASAVFLLSLDGIAFDTILPATKFVSGIVIIMLFFAVLAAANNHVPDLHSVVVGIRYHLPAMVLAYCLLMAFLHMFANMQAETRHIIYGIYGSGSPSMAKNWMFMGFVFSFACLRLWVSLFILTTVFKWSCTENAKAVSAKQT